MNKIEVYDSLVNKIFDMPDTLAKSYLKNNGIKIDERGVIVAGRYALATNIDIEGSGVDSIQVVDWMTKKETTRSFKEAVKETVKEVEVIEPLVIEEVKSETIEEKTIEVVEEKPAKKTRKRKAKTEE